MSIGLHGRLVIARRLDTGATVPRMTLIPAGSLSGERLMFTATDLKKCKVYEDEPPISLEVGEYVEIEPPSTPGLVTRILAWNSDDGPAKTGSLTASGANGYKWHEILLFIPKGIYTSAIARDSNARTNYPNAIAQRMGR